MQITANKNRQKNIKIFRRNKMSTFKEKIAIIRAEIINNHEAFMEKLEKDKKSFYGFKGSKRGMIPFLSPKELAQHLGVSLKTLERMRKDGSGPPFRTVSKQIRYSIVSLDIWFAEKETIQLPANSDGHE